MADSRKKKHKAKEPKKRTKQAQSGFSVRHAWREILLIAGAAFISMWPVIYTEFTELDDKHLILTRMARMMSNPMSAWTNSIFTPHYKPLVLLSWILEGQVFGLKSGVLHFNNLLLHAVDSILVFFVVRRLAGLFDGAQGRVQVISLFTALLFAVHPLHVESIAWAIERKDVLYTFFFLLGILAYFRYLDKGSLKWMLLTALCFICSVLSKAPAIVFPLVLLLIDWAHRRPLKVVRLTEKWPVMIVFIVGLVLYGVFGGRSHKPGVEVEGSIAKMISEKPVSDVYPLTEFPSLYTKVALIGLKGTFWYAHSYLPVGLSLAYPYRSWLPKIGQAIHLFPILLVLGLFVVWRYRERRRLLFFGHVFFFTALAPALIRTGLGKGIFLSDRYVYLALLGLLFFIVSGLVQIMDQRRWHIRRQSVVLSLLVVVLAVMSFFQARVWHNGETLWGNVIDKYPSIDYAYVNRSVWYKEHEQADKALADLNTAVSLDQFDEHALVHRGTLLRQLGRSEEALKDFESALRIKPGSEHAINGKANALFSMQRYAEAEATYTEGMQHNPRMSTLYVNRAAARYYLGKNQEALADLDEAARLNPGYAGVYQKRTVIYMGMQDYENAVINARKAAQYEPQNHANFGDLGVALQRLGRHPEAIDALTKAIAIFKGERYYRARAQSYEAIGNSAAAAQDLRIADSLK